MNQPPTPYAWTITTDRIDDGDAVGMCGPFGCHLTEDEIKHHADVERFRLLDGDGDVYLYGYYIDLSGSSSGFGPLDDLGRSYGCTSIQYRDNHGEYVEL